MVVVHPGRPGRGSERRRDFFVLEPLLRAEQEDLALQPRQHEQSRRQPRFSVACLSELVRVAASVVYPLAERNQLPPNRLAAVIFQHIPANRQEPGAELTLPAKPVHTAKRTDEGLLYEILEV